MDAIPTQLISARFSGATEIHVVHDYRPADFPRVAEAAPFVSNLGLPTILNHLVEDPKFIADTIPDGGHFQRRQGIEKTGCYPAESAVAETRLLFLAEQFIKIIA